MKMTPAQLRERIHELSKLGALELRAEWTKVYRTTAPRHISRDLLLRGIAYRLQERMYGGLKASTLRRLQKIAADLETEPQATPLQASALKPGVRLIREWKGETHVVEVLVKGFAWQGETYRSLSAIARTITSTQWSGPDFFGLRDKRSREAVEPGALIKAFK